MTGRFVIAFVLAVGMACGPRPFVLSQDVRDSIAICTGSYSATASRALQAELVSRRAGLITSSEVTERGESTFQFGELQGRDAIEMYNSYVACVNQNRTQLSDTDDGDGDVTIPRCPAALAWNGRAGSWGLDYNCVLLNGSNRQRWCVLTVECVNGDRTRGTDAREVLIPSGEVQRASGWVGCNTSTGSPVLEVNAEIECDILP